MRLMTAAILCLVPSLSLAQDPVSRVDAFVQEQMAKRHIPGVSIAVVQGGKVVLSKGYGLANVELSVPATAETVYQLASVTKPFTATAVVMLAKDGKLSLDDKLTERLEGLPKTWDGVTVRHLLTHTSGIKNLTNLPEFPRTMRQDFTPRELIERVAKLPLDFAPGARWDYSNTNYILLGMLIEKASGQSYSDFMADRIFKPLGMTNTRGNDLHAIIPGRAQGYSWDGKGWRVGEYHSPSQPYAAGMLVSTVADLAKWDLALDAETLLKKADLEPMWTPAPLPSGKASYGLGWGIEAVNGHRMITHGGGIPGFSTQVTRFPEDRLSVYVLTNLDGSHAGNIARGVAARFLSALADETPRPIADDDPDTSGRIREMLKQAQKGELAAEQFSEPAQKRLVPLIRADTDRLASFGTLKTFELLERKKSGDRVALRYLVVFENETIKLSITLNKDGKIEGVGMQSVE